MTNTQTFSKKRGHDDYVDNDDDDNHDGDDDNNETGQLDSNVNAFPLNVKFYGNISSLQKKLLQTDFAHIFFKVWDYLQILYGHYLPFSIRKEVHTIFINSITTKISTFHNIQ